MDEAHLTLESVIDPSLQNSSSIDGPDATVDAGLPSAIDDDAEPFPADTADSGEGPARGEPAKTKASGKPEPKRKRKPLAPGSAAEFKRKEANRLAAERSRSRASEKARALDKAYAALSQEHDELEAAIARIEDVNGEHAAEAEAKARLDREEQEQQDVQAQVEAALAVAQRELEAAAAAAAAGTGSGASEMHRDRDGGSLLDAFMSGNISIDGMDGFDPNGDDWVQGVENLIQEAETKGRLGELASVAAVPAEESDAQAASVGDGAVQVVADVSGQGVETESSPTATMTANGQRTDLGDAKLALAAADKIKQPFIYIAADAAAATADAVAVVLNAEIERIVRDDVANTRAAIARIEKEIARAQGLGPVEDNDAESGPSQLPEEVSSNDQLELDRAVEAAQASKSALEAGIRELSTRIVAAREAKLTQEAVVAKGVEELRKFALKADEDERGSVMQVLKSIRGYLGNLIWGLDDEASPEDTLLDAAFSTPAIARRRRGRPPKINFPLSYNHASLIYPSLPLDSPTTMPNNSAAPSGSKVYPAGSEGAELGSDAPAKPKAKPRTKRKRDTPGLGANQASASDPDGTVDALPPPTPAPKRAGRAVRGRKSKLPYEVILDLPVAPALVPDTTHGIMDSAVNDDDMIHDIAAKAEDYLLSQLTAAEATAAGGSSSFEMPTSARDPAFESDEWTDAVLAGLRKNGPGACDVCGRTETSVWRRLVLSGDDEYRVCNACGLYHRKFGVIRPPSLWGDGEALKKRRPASGPDDGRRNRKVRKMLQEADELHEQALANGTEGGEEDDAGVVGGVTDDVDGGADHAEDLGAGMLGTSEEFDTALLDEATAAAATAAAGTVTDPPGPEPTDIEPNKTGTQPSFTAVTTPHLGSPAPTSSLGAFHRTPGVGVGIGVGVGVGVGLGGSRHSQTLPIASLPLSTFPTAGLAVSDGNDHHVDVDVSEFEAIEEELRGSLGDALFAGLDG